MKENYELAIFALLSVHLRCYTAPVDTLRASWAITGSPSEARWVIRRAHLRQRLRWASFASIHERRMVGAGGLEPLTSSVSGRRYSQLSYAPVVAKTGENPNLQYNLTRLRRSSPGFASLVAELFSCPALTGESTRPFSLSPPDVSGQCPAFRPSRAGRRRIPHRAGGPERPVSDRARGCRHWRG